ncbi:MAG: MoaD/ThiS family protein [Desulfobacteraceae bacterium]|jgi:molybdopterin converting factor small subunit
MAVTIYIPLIHRHLSDDVETVEVDGKTVGECFHQLIKRFPNLQNAIFNKKGELQNLLEVFLNAKSAYPDELARSTKDGDEIHITTILSGG